MTFTAETLPRWKALIERQVAELNRVHGISAMVSSNKPKSARNEAIAALVATSSSRKRSTRRQPDKATEPASDLVSLLVSASRGQGRAAGRRARR